MVHEGCRILQNWISRCRRLLLLCIVNFCCRLILSRLWRPFLHCLSLFLWVFFWLEFQILTPFVLFLSKECRIILCTFFIILFSFTIITVDKVTFINNYFRYFLSLLGLSLNIGLSSNFLSAIFHYFGCFQIFFKLFQTLTLRRNEYRITICSLF